ncbi:MAG TPA: RNA polymerase sigma factor [Candidatus Saccharimonadales bacterium]|nr:RNA polymerase sigma factor [Candidatus Saccharimonadales bacterium]
MLTLSSLAVLFSTERRSGDPDAAAGGYPQSERLPVDAQLVALAKEDRDRAFELLYNAYRGRIFTFLLRISGSAETADDLAQDTFVKAHGAIGRLEGDQKLLPWLYRIANNTAIDHLRRRKRFAWLPWTDLHGTAEEPHADDTHTARRTRAEIGEILRSLPPDNAAALLLHALEGYSYEEIAQIQGTTMSAARSRIARARAAFKDRYPA